MSMAACHTSPEVQVPAPVSGSIDLSTYTEFDVNWNEGSVHFEGLGWVMALIPFAWGETYPVYMVNDTAYDVTGDLNWEAYDGAVLRWSGSCCGFSVPAMGATWMHVRIPSFEITPPTVTHCLLKIRVY
jgi:hypothetical protein